ncbi:MAG: DsbC family protein [Gammaproteobacteria bacterium]|nr:DsbC family protein [Gammaproteobacteria bacterium]
MKLAWLAMASWVLSNGVMANSMDEVKQRLVAQIPELADAKVSATPIPGLFSVQQGAFVFYSSADGQYVLRGDLLSLSDKRNLTEEAQQAFRVASLSRLSDKDTINYNPEKGKATHRITVFTDVDCPYCHQMHQMLPKLLDSGIAVRYVMYPRAGIDSPSYHKTVHAWCQRANKQELDQMMKGGSAPAKLSSCVNPIKQQFELANELGLQGTPSIILADGSLIPGLAPLDELVRLVKSSK